MDPRENSVIEEIESLFIVKRFDEALAKCEQELRALRRLAKHPETPNTHGKSKTLPTSAGLGGGGGVSADASQALDSAVHGFDAHTKLPRHIPSLRGNALSMSTSATTDLDESSSGGPGFDLAVESLPLVQLMLQLLFETQRSNEIMPFVKDFYGSEVEGVPLDIVYMWCVVSSPESSKPEKSFD